jgi:hypothetical protein
VNSVAGFAVDPAHPGTAYAAGTLVYRTTDYGAHWDQLRGPSAQGSFQFPAVAVEESGALLVLASDGRVFRSNDGGETFSALTNFSINEAITFARSGGAIHLGGRRGTNAMVAKLDWSGNIVYATYWGGHVQESATAVDVDSDGNVYVAGSGWSPDFPARDAVRGYSGQGDAFLLKLDASGAPVYSTFWGGSFSEQSVSVAAGQGGTVYFAGNTGSMDFPVSGGAGGSGPGSMFLVGMR